MKEKVFAIVMLLVAFATSANAQSVAYSFNFKYDDYKTNAQVLIYDNLTAIFKGYNNEGYSIKP